MIEFINKMRAREEDDFEVCEMDVDKSFEETVVETSENDISQDDSQVQLFLQAQKIAGFLMLVVVLFCVAKCVLNRTRNTHYVYIQICYSKINEPLFPCYVLLRVT